MFSRFGDSGFNNVSDVTIREQKRGKFVEEGIKMGKDFRMKAKAMENPLIFDLVHELI